MFKHAEVVLNIVSWWLLGFRD